MSGRKLTADEMRKFPKIELHRHLEGAFPLDFLYEMAKKNGIAVPKDIQEFKEQNQFPKNGEPDFLLFLSKFKNDWYRSMQDVYDIAYHSVKQFTQDGIFYIEMRFSPEHFALQNNFDRLEVAKTVIEASNKAAKEEGFYIKYLITLNRGKQVAEEMIELYKRIKEASPDIVGYDLAGDETNFPPENFVPFFKLINEDGKYKATIHAGEVTPSSQVWTAINDLHASRIGHGTSTIKDEKLQKELIARSIPLEFCITSNYQTGSWRDIPTHPAGALYKMGVPISLGSDDPTIQNADLTDDYLLAQKHFDLDSEDFRKINLIGLKNSFLDDDLKAKLLKEYEKKVKNFL
jgi:adenosine deaminase